MFEKEAEEIAKYIYIHHFDDDVIYPNVLKAIIAGVQKGAEFGYNKANEWQYVKDEKDLPTDKTEYLLLLENGIRTFGFYNGKWWESWKGDLSWQEVKAYFFVPVPELKENE